MVKPSAPRDRLGLRSSPRHNPPLSHYNVRRRVTSNHGSRSRDSPCSRIHGTHSPYSRGIPTTMRPARSSRPGLLRGRKGGMNSAPHRTLPVRGGRLCASCWFPESQRLQQESCPRRRRPRVTRIRPLRRAPFCLGLCSVGCPMSAPLESPPKVFKNLSGQIIALIWRRSMLTPGSAHVRRPPWLSLGIVLLGFFRQARRPARGVGEGLQGLLLQLDRAEIIAHEADEPNAGSTCLIPRRRAASANQNRRDGAFMKICRKRSSHQTLAAIPPAS